MSRLCDETRLFHCIHPGTQTTPQKPFPTRKIIELDMPDPVQQVPKPKKQSKTSKRLLGSSFVKRGETPP